MLANEPSLNCGVFAHSRKRHVCSSTAFQFFIVVAFVSATSREDSVPDDDSDLQAAAFRSLRVVTTVVTVTITITTPGRPTPYTIESR